MMGTGGTTNDAAWGSSGKGLCSKTPNFDEAGDSAALSGRGAVAAQGARGASSRAWRSYRRNREAAWRRRGDVENQNKFTNFSREAGDGASHARAERARPNAAVTLALAVSGNDCN